MISAAGIPVIVDGIVAGVRFEDVKVVADNAVTAGQSSIAMFVRSSTAVSLVRTELVAGTGAAGAAGAHNPSLLSGIKGGVGTRACACVVPTDCPICDPWDPWCGDDGINFCGGTEVSGGTFLFPFGGTGYGMPFEMSGGAPGADAGVSCSTGAYACTIGQAGQNGTDRTVSPTLGEPELLATGWRGVPGGAGSQGGFGQGGGAGGRGSSYTYDYVCGSAAAPRCEDTNYPNTPAGGGGGSGGCGGLGGNGGQAGGASISLMSMSSVVAINASTLVAVAAGRGGVGGAGALGELGGRGGEGGAGLTGQPVTRGCAGGLGGRGGKGAAGGGGSGGPSASIAYVGPLPTVDPSSQLSHGSAGLGGLDGNGAAIGKGTDGQASNLLHVPGPDTVAPTGGGLNSPTLTTCGVLTVQLSPAMDDRSPANQIQQEVCTSTVAGGCATNFVRRAIGITSVSIDMYPQWGQTVYLRARPLDAAGNVGAMSAELAVAIPRPPPPVWTAGNVTVAPIAPVGRYQIQWPAVSASCANQPVVLSLCQGTTCSTLLATDTSATRNASCVGSTTYTVKVTDNLSPEATRSGSGSWPVSYATHISPAYTAAGCRGGCHGTSPKFTQTGDKVNNAFHTCAGWKLIGTTANTSDIFRVADLHSHCDNSAHPGGTMSQGDRDLLRCWIDQGAP